MPDKAKVRSKAIRTLRQSGYSDEDIRLVLDLGSAEDVESLLLPEIRDGFEDFVIRIRDDILRLASENGGQALSRFLTDLVTNEGTRLTLDEAKVVMACPISSFFSDKDLLLRASLKASSEMVRKI